jgi:hypothetical protein
MMHARDCPENLKNSAQCEIAQSSDHGYSSTRMVKAQDAKHKRAIRDYGCGLSIATLSAVTQQPRRELRAPTRSRADVAFARQIAMYLAHTKFGIPYAEVGEYFNRDRTTVAHACQLVEDKRDNLEFDDHLARMERLIDAALPETSAIGQTLLQRSVGGNI